MSKKISFQQLVERIAAESGESTELTHDFIKDLVAIINDNLEQGEPVTLAGFGKFKLRKIDKREGISPQTGKSMTIPAQNKVIFKPNEELQQKVNAPFAHLKSQLLDDEDESPSEDEQTEFFTPPSSNPSEISLPNDLDKIDAEPESEEDPFGFGTGAQTSDQFSYDPFSSIEENEDDVVEYQPGMHEESDEIFPGATATELEKNEPESEKGTGKDPSTEDTPADKEPSPPVKTRKEKTKEQKGIHFKDRRPHRKRMSGGGLLLIMAAIFLLFILVGGWYFVQWVEEEASAGEQTNISQVHPSSANDENKTGGDNNTSKITSHTVQRGDTLWGLADDNYQEPQLWPWIYNENKSSLTDPNLIKAGQQLEIPEPETRESGFRKNDSLQVAIGYTETYRWYKNNNIDEAKYYLYAAIKYHSEVLEHTDVEVEESDLAFANQATD